jgi:hypothetical protein
MVKINDVIQLDPAQSPWGPLLCIVDEVKSWGVQCYALVPEHREEPPNRMYLRIEHGKYIEIGAAEWTVEVRLRTVDPESA